MQKIRLYDATKLDREHMMFSNKQLITLLLPIMVEQLLNSFMGMADTMMVSNVGSAAISAVSLVDSINVLVIQVFTALGAGAAIICSQYLGRGDRESSNEAARQVTLSVLTISTVLSILCIVFRGPLLHLIFGQVEEAVMDISMIYFLLTAISFPFIALFDAGGAFYRAAGNSRFPMMISVLSNGLNIAGNAVLIFGFQMGVEGAALSTLFSRIFCAVVIFWNLRKPDQVIVVNHYLKIRPNFPLIGKILSIGIPSGIENGMFQFGKLAIQSSVSTLGTAAIAAQAMTIILENLNGIGAIGIGIGLMTVVGQCIGAGKVEEARYYMVKLCGYAEIVILISCAVVFLLTKPVSWNGSRKCLPLHGNDNSNYDCKTDCMGAGIYPGLWHACRRRCEIFHDFIQPYHVVLPCGTVCISDPQLWFRTNGGVDWHVCRLDASCYRIQRPVSKRQVEPDTCHLEHA